MSKVNNPCPTRRATSRPWENHMLILDNYDHGSTAPYQSWVLLTKTETVEVADDEPVAED